MQASHSVALALIAVLASATSASAQEGEPAVPPGYETQPPGDAPPPSDPYAQPAPAPVYPSPQPVYAQPAYPHTAPPTERPPREIRDVSLTVSPAHLFLPIVELMGDIRLIDKLSAAVILGFGAVQVTPDDRATVFEAGAQLKFYAIGDFDHAMQIGAEILFIHLSADLASRGVTGTGSGLAFGPFLGYKFVASGGFTLDVQLGFQYAGVFASATDGTTTEETSDAEIIPLLNLNLGWSF